jgi:hypothetical protein
MTGDEVETRLQAHGLTVPRTVLYRVALTPVEETSVVRVEQGEVVFNERGWYEVLLTVSWDPSNREGHRFAHTSIPDSHPLHSEAIEAAVLSDLSGGRQLLRGNTIFDPDSAISSLALEVWHDASEPIAIEVASIGLRRLGP